MDDDKLLRKVLLLGIAVFILLITVLFVAALKIIPEDPFENKSLELCTIWYNSSDSNETLDCVHFLLDLRNSNDTVNIYHNSSLNDTKKYVDSRLDDFITYSEFSNRIEELHLVLRDEISKDLNVSQLTEAQAKRNHDYRMKELELGSLDSDYITMEDVTLEISKALVSGVSSEPQPSLNPSFPEIPWFAYALFLVLIVMGYKYSTSKTIEKRNAPLPGAMPNGYKLVKEVKEKDGPPKFIDEIEVPDGKKQ